MGTNGGIKLQRPVPSVLGPEPWVLEPFVLGPKDQGPQDQGDQGLTVQDSVPFFLLGNDCDLDAKVGGFAFWQTYYSISAHFGNVRLPSFAHAHAHSPDTYPCPAVHSRGRQTRAGTSLAGLLQSTFKPRPNSSRSTSSTLCSSAKARVGSVKPALAVNRPALAFVRQDPGRFGHQS